MAAYGPETTTDEVLAGHDLSGTTALVTGASTGLGKETARALAAHGANVIMAVRNPWKGQEAAAEVRRAVDGSDAQIDLVQLDLADLTSVRACADGVAERYESLNLLVANAGVMACPYERTNDGFEMQFGTNHLGHFVLVNRLVPLLLAGAPSRVVILSSGGHRMSGVDLDDPNFDTTPYDPWTAYGRSKTANALYAVALDARLRERGVRAAAVHPGMIMTELGRHLTDESLGALGARLAGRRPTQKSVEAGAATTVWAAAVADADDVGGRYCEDCGVSDVLDDGADLTSPTGVLPHAADPAVAEALWARSEELVGEHFSW